jgi:hypothetical protein
MSRSAPFCPFNALSSHTLLANLVLKLDSFKLASLTLNVRFGENRMTGTGRNQLVATDSKRPKGDDRVFCLYF